MKSFLNSKKPIITAMVTETTVEANLDKIEAYKNQGTEAFCFQFERLIPSDKAPERLKLLFDAMDGYPIYATNYMRGNSEADTISWETIEDQLLLLHSLGATLIDIPADMYHPSDMELATDQKAIERQKAFINKLHERGAEVLMSAHVLRFIPKETAYTIALAQMERGADIAKIVTWADTDEELAENFEISMMLSKNLKIKSLFLCGGEKRKRHRLLGPLFGSAIYLVRTNEDNDIQPKIKDAKAVLEYLD